MKKLLAFLPLFVLSISLFAQSGISATDLRTLKKKEDSLKVLARQIYKEEELGSRMRADSQFVKTLVRSLQVKNSFRFSFDSVQGISRLYAPDSAFRIFSWQISFDDQYNYTRQRGAIQLKTADGSLKLIPLKDYSEFADDPADSVRTKDTWIGAVYYNIIKTSHAGKNYYTLFGFDANSYKSNKKWVEVLTFDANNQPVFGGRYFSYAKDSAKKDDQYRFVIEYKKEASTFLNYDPDMQMILVDHLISESEDSDSPWTFIPDGDYEGFKWEGGKWVHVDKVFHFTLKDGEFPMPDPLRDNDGNNNAEKLRQQIEKNERKEKPATPAVPKKKGNL